MRTLYNFQKILRHFSSLHVLCHQGDLLLNDLNNGVHTYTLFYPHSQVDTLKQYVCNEIYSDNSCWMFVYNGSLNNWRISLMKLSTLIRKFCCLTYAMRTTNVVSPPQSIKFRAGIKAYFLYHLKNVRFYEYGNHFVEYTMLLLSCGQHCGIYFHVISMEILNIYRFFYISFHYHSSGYISYEAFV